MTAAAVILAAGASTRLGEPKQLVRLQGETLLDRALRVAREAGCHPIVVVLGAFADRIRRECLLEGARVVVNEEWQEGMASSIRQGVEGLQTLEGAVLLTCDMPAVTPGHLRALIATGTLTGSRYGGRTGVPAFFPAAAFSALLALTGDQGARGMLAEAPSVPLAGGELDIDLPEDLAMLGSL